MAFAGPKNFAAVPHAKKAKKILLPRSLIPPSFLPVLPRRGPTRLSNRSTGPARTVMLLLARFVSFGLPPAREQIGQKGLTGIEHGPYRTKRGKNKMSYRTAKHKS